MRNSPPICFVLACALLSIVPLPRANANADRARGDERTFHRPKAEVDKAIQDLHATLNGRLPILDGFADKADEQWDHFTRGYYECAVQVVANGQEETRVLVTAKITAWYTDPNPTQSGYRVLLSNGRVESDLLDRIEEALATKGPVSAAPQSSQPLASSPESSVHSSMMPPATRIRPGMTTLPVAGASDLVRGESAGSPNSIGSSATAVITAPTGSEEIESMRRRREEAEKKVSDLSSVVQNLEDILRNQTHPTDIGVVRKPGTHVMSKPVANGPVLFSAENEDEFQVLDSGPDWVHVQISGVSRGWIRRSDLTLPEGLNGNSTKAAAASASEPSLRVIREETTTFKGNWEPLNGKTVRIIWTAPASAQVTPVPALAKRSFAKSRFLTAYQEISSHDQAVAGVVIVFDSADGGQIAATIQNLRQWQAGSLPDASFWRLCSVDPPELLSP